MNVTRSRCTGSIVARIGGLTVAMIAGLSALVQAQTTVALTAANCPACTSANLAAWRSLRDDSLGASVRDKRGHEIGFTTADNGKWEPMTSTKQTMCGKLYRFHYVWNGDNDWSFNIVPEGASAETFLFARQHLGAGSYQKKCDNQDCVHGEINMDQSFPRDDFFKIIPHPQQSLASQFGIELEPELDTDNMIGESICMYGPWIRDRNHEDKPEIHPAEAIWWSRVPTRSAWWGLWITARETHHIMLLQDDSNRFDRDEDFDCVAPFADMGMPGPIDQLCVFPPSFRAWSDVPRREEVRLAIDASMGGTIVTNYDIKERHARNITTSSNASASADQGPGTEYVVTYDGATVMRVRELQPDGNLGVKLDTFCRDAETNSIRGVLVMNTEFGKDDRGDEGYQVLEINRTDANVKLLAFLEGATEAIRTAQVIPRVDSSVLRLMNETRYVKRIDLAPDPVPRGMLRRKGTELVMDFARSEGDSTIVARDVPVLRFGSIAATDTGAYAQRTVRALSLMPVARSRHEAAAIPSASAWPAIAAAAGIQNSGRGSPAPVVRANEWMVHVWPRYAGWSAEEENAEPPTRVAIALNAALDSAERGQAPTLATALYQSATPFRARWSFKAARITAAGASPVRIAPRDTPGSVVVDTTGGTAIHQVLKVRFPDAGLYRVDITGTYTDEFGVTGVVKHVLWSHYLKPGRDTTGSELVRGMATLVNTPAAAMLRAGAIHGDSVERRGAVAIRQHHAGALRAAAIRASSAGRLTPDELRLLYRLSSGYKRAQ